jgi:hypothetical protein
MMKIALGLVVALMLAACADMHGAPRIADSGVGHPAGDYPGPRLY